MKAPPKRGPDMHARSVKFASPVLLQTRLQRWRSRFLLGVLALLFVAVGGRAIWMQTVQGQYLIAKGQKQYEREVELPATRGKILDRNGAVLATSLPARSVWAFPDKTDLADPRMADLARLLGYRHDDLIKRLRDGEDFVFLRRQVELNVAERIRALQIKGIGLDREYKRYYPEGESTAHLVGFTGIEHNGQEGLELSFDSLLGGVPGKRRVFRDGSGQIIGGMDASLEPRDGSDLKLTIDTRIQFQAHQAIKEAVDLHQAKSGAVVVLDARNGDVLALANWPSYDPNQRRGRNSDNLRNRAITDIFEPGSTAKPFTAAMALESGRYKPQTMFDVTEGKMKIGRDTIRDSHRQKEPLTLEQVIQKSSNIGTARMALDLPAQDLYRVLHDAGFGQTPRMGFPGAGGGLLRPSKTWKPIEHATISYGHGFAASLMQIARAYTIFGTNGELLPVNLFHRGDDDKTFGGRIVKVAANAGGGAANSATVAARDEGARDTIRGTRVIKAETARAVRHMLEMAVDRNGTAPQARVHGYRVGGKTGTALKIENGRYVKKYVSSFVGMAPMSDPRLIVAVMLDEPSAGKSYYGGAVAAPVFSTVTYDALRTLQIAPDAPFDSQILQATGGSDAAATPAMRRAGLAAAPTARSATAAARPAARGEGRAEGSARSGSPAKVGPRPASQVAAPVRPTAPETMTTPARTQLTPRGQGSAGSSGSTGTSGSPAKNPSTKPVAMPRPLVATGGAA